MLINFKHSLIPGKQIREAVRKLARYTRHLRQAAKDSSYQFAESSVFLPSDSKISREITALVRKKKTEKLKMILVVGIGGSSLGAQALYDVYYGFSDRLDGSRFPRMLFIDTLDQEQTGLVTEFLKKKIRSLEEVLVVLISKSGGTTESIANADLICTALKGVSGVHDRIIAITDAESRLWHLAKEHMMSSVAIPSAVGGRFSVFSAVGLLPLAFLGFDVKSLVKGARAMRDACLAKSDNPAAISASILFEHARAGRRIHDTFLFHPELESLGKWYRQLLAESIGKELDRDGKRVCAGILPTVSIGSTDLHSVGQLYFGGPDVRVTTFVTSSFIADKPVVAKRGMFSSLVSGISGKSPGSIMSAIAQGTLHAYIKRKLPVIETTLPGLTPQSLGGWMQFKMLEVMYLGELFNVNAFDQPHVELYKEEARKLLTQEPCT